MLNQIERCCRYAERFGRRVIVDTSYKGARTFRSPFYKYFVSMQEGLELRNAIPEAELNSMDVIPAVLKGRINNYDLQHDPVLRCRLDKLSRVPLTFDFSLDYDEDIVLHHQFGGGRLAIAALQRLRLHDSLNDAFAERLQMLPPDYHAVHVRHTDIKIDYAECLSNLAARGIRDLFVATDNADVLAEFRNDMTGAFVHSFSELPQNDGKPIHLAPPWDIAESRNRDAILDLLTLAAARHLTIPGATGANPKVRSGFGVLAEGLQKNKPVLRKLIGRLDVLAILERPSSPDTKPVSA
ncbi:hypothetical protein [Aestuariivirga sp.]|uniref:hypothetical protein n=1 Tax=Aestuariivirga sp. TaxID=2650926 RepID=UPI0037852DBC